MRARALSGFTVLSLLLGVGCQGAAPAPPTSAPAAAPTAAPTKPAAVASPSASPSPAASPAAAASPKPAASPAASPSAAASPSPLAAGRVINFDAADYSYTLPDTLAAGQVTLVMRNVGQVPHQAQLMKLNTGVTLQQLTAALAQSGESAALTLVTLGGGPGILDPGPNTEQVTVDLQEGNYVVASFLVDQDGTPQFVKGMVKTLQVTPATPGAATSQPNAPVAITLRDFDFETPGNIPSGNTTWRINNAGPQPHELQVAKLPGGGSTDDILKVYTTLPPPPRTFQSLGGMQGLSPNTNGFLALNLQAGDYAFYCTMPDPNTGQRHLQEGMLKQITIR